MMRGDRDVKGIGVGSRWKGLLLDDPNRKLGRLGLQGQHGDFC